MIQRVIGLLAVVFALAVTAGPPAGAVAPPEVAQDAAPPTGNAGPVVPMAQRGQCVTTGVLPNTDPRTATPNQLSLNLSEAWRHSRGDGQTVAVIDTGVQPGPRLPNVEAGGDFLESTDGRTDCDGHGTLVAGLIAGQPGDDGFSGVAPGARLIAIRQTSARFAPRSPGPDPASARAAVEVASLARAVVRAADLGARVINISAVTCLAANKTVDQTELGAALKYAAVQKDAVIVAAAGNIRGGLTAGSTCETNSGGWADVTSVSIPSWWQPFVLSVGSVAENGMPSEFSMAGPWLGIAAPGEHIVSLSNAPGGGLANGLPNEQSELFGISGTSFAAAYVSGVAALVRSRFLDLTAAEVIHRITATARGAARSPSNVVGAGLVDAVAALTWDVTQSPRSDPAAVRQVAAPPTPPEADTTPRNVAFIGAAVLLSAAVVAVGIHRRKESGR
ncbi:type VII secretion-associated serine protease mycosin [Mycobacterium sp. 3519A]|uniref:type VII secretion-associated serine protease mycosin n=1 Tax=Mycobacterium sp. 3519A TaxID=2057184 RepID=UPI000C7B8541|nr:type VII secretion-associated serine protease mycosin [Mycobacterium sp. 3519A]